MLRWMYNRMLIFLRLLQRFGLNFVQSIRGFVGSIGILMGLGRLLEYGLSASVGFSTSRVFGVVLLLGGLLLVLTRTRRLQPIGRVAASIATACFVFMSVGTWGNNAANLYAFCALYCVIEAASRRVYEY
jgi:hypothetical protein